MNWMLRLIERRRAILSDPQAMGDLAVMICTVLGWVFVCLMLSGVIG